MTVARLRSEISNLEYLRWGRYYALKAQRIQLGQLKTKG